MDRTIAKEQKDNAGRADENATNGGEQPASIRVPVVCTRLCAHCEIVRGRTLPNSEHLKVLIRLPEPERLRVQRSLAGAALAKIEPHLLPHDPGGGAGTDARQGQQPPASSAEETRRAREKEDMLSVLALVAASAAQHLLAEKSSNSDSRGDRENDAPGTLPSAPAAEFKIQKEGTRMACSACRTTWYCSRECQRADRERHKRDDCVDTKLTRRVAQAFAVDLLRGVAVWHEAVQVQRVRGRGLFWTVFALPELVPLARADPPFSEHLLKLEFMPLAQLEREAAEARRTGSDDIFATAAPLVANMDPSNDVVVLFTAIESECGGSSQCFGISIAADDAWRMYLACQHIFSSSFPGADAFLAQQLVS